MRAARLIPLACLLASSATRPGPLRAPAQGPHRAGVLAHLLGHLRRAALLAARPDPARERGEAAAGVGLPGARRPGRFEATPLVADGVMYLTEPPGRVVALDVRTGRSLWRWEPDDAEGRAHPRLRPAPTAAWRCSTTRSTSGTLDAQLVALDAASGAVRWTCTSGRQHARLRDHRRRRWPSTDKVIVGVSGGEAGIRGFLDAYDAKTGKRALALRTPSPDPASPATTPGAATAGRPAAGPTWLTGLLRPDAEPALLGQSATPAPTGTATSARATTSTPARSSPSRRRPAGCAGISSSRRTTRTTGTRTRSRCLSTPRWADGRGSSCVTGQPQRLLLRARPGDRRVPARHALREADVGHRASTRRAGRSRFPAQEPSERARSSGRACRARPTGSARPTARRPASSTCPCARWARSTTRARRSTSRAAYFMGGRRGMRPGEEAYGRGARARRADRRAGAGSSGCCRRPGPA